MSGFFFYIDLQPIVVDLIKNERVLLSRIIEKLA